MEYRSTRRSRRRFLSKTIAAAAALLKAASAKPALVRASDPEPERLTRLLAKYGSELGDLRRVEGGN